MLKVFLFTSILAMLVLTACGGGSTAGNAQTGDPAKVVEAYLTAKVKVDQDTVRKLLCSAKEKDYQTEAATFLGVTDPQIEGMQCTRVGQDNKVKCAGKIVAQYGAEKNEFPLVTYRVVQEDGEWKWCGETQ